MPHAGSWIRRMRRDAYLARDNSWCVLCGEAAATTLDHLTPRCRRGKNSVPNIVAACEPCNSFKRDMTLQEFLAARIPDDPARQRAEKTRILRQAKRRVDAIYNALVFDAQVESVIRRMTHQGLLVDLRQPHMPSRIELSVLLAGVSGPKLGWIRALLGAHGIPTATSEVHAETRIEVPRVCLPEAQGLLQVTWLELPDDDDFFKGEAHVTH